MRDIYLDNAATTYPKPEKVYVQMDRVNRELAVNAGRGSYALGREATNIIDQVREELLALTNAKQVAKVVLTSSATIALNEIIGGIRWKKEDVVYVSPYEHNAVMRPLHLMQQQYEFSIEELPYDSEVGAIDIDKMIFLFGQRPPTAVFLSHISNVTGYIIPIEQITELAKELGAVVTVDASQSLGLIPIDMSTVKADYVVFAGHKNLYGPFGCGGFFVRNGNELQPYLAGGTGSDSLNLEMPDSSPGRYEPASPNIVAYAGLLAALEVIRDEENGQQAYERHELELTQYLVEKLGEISQVRLYPVQQDRHIGIVAFNIQGYKASDAGMLLDEDYHIAVRTGYHCAPLIHAHLGDTGYAGVVRASVGRYTSKEDVDALVAAVRELAD